MILAQIAGGTATVTQVLAGDVGRIAWNIFLALVPLTLSFFLFNKPRSRLFCWSTYSLLGISFVVGIKKYQDGDLLQAVKRIVISFWGVRLIFLGMAIGLIIILMIVDRQAQGSVGRHRSILWWIGVGLFIVILPNAPYILTDIIHFYDAVRAISSVWEITLIIVPVYLVFIGVGWFAYVFSLVNIRQYLRRNQLQNRITIIETSLHLVCAIGIYIGRFIRFNSWSLVTQPQQFLSVLPGELMGRFPLLVILLTFLIITCFYTISKSLVEKSSIYRDN